MCPIQYASCATHDVLAYVDSFDPARDAPLCCISAKPAVQRWIAAKMVKSTSLRLCRSLQYRCSGACGWGSRLDVCFTNYAKKQMLADGCRTACLLCGEDMVASKDYF